MASKFSTGIQKDDEIYSQQMAEIFPLISNLANCIQLKDLEAARPLLLLLKIRVYKLNPQRKDGIILQFIECFGSYNRVDIAKPFLVELFCYLKSLALLNLADAAKVQFVEAKKRVLHPIEQFKYIFNEEKQEKNDLFWNCRGLYSLSVAEVLFHLQFTFMESKKTTIDNIIFAGEAAVHVIGALNGDPAAIIWLLKSGIYAVSHMVRKSNSQRMEARLVTSETFNYITMNNHFEDAYAQQIVDQVIVCFNKVNTHRNGLSDWLILYSYLEVLVNVTHRFSDPLNPSHVAIQTTVLTFLKTQLPFRGSRALQCLYLSASVMSTIDTRIEARVVEIFRLLHLSPIKSVVEDCERFFAKYRMQKKGRSLTNHEVISTFMNSNAEKQLEFLADVQMVDFLWYNFAESLLVELLETEPDIVTGLSTLSNDTYINSSEAQHIRLRIPTFYDRVTQFAQHSTVNKPEHFWQCFCNRIVAGNVRGGSWTTLSNPPEKGITNSVSPVALPYKLHTATDSPLARSTTLSGSDDTFEPAVIRTIERPALKAMADDDFDTVVYKIFESSEVLNLSIEESIDCIRSIITVGRSRTMQADDKNILMVVGSTGSGKSTTINWLFGCSMMFLNEEDGCITVRAEKDKGRKDMVTQIGLDSTRSQTLVPVTLHLDDKLTICDAPGFMESRGPEVSIGNAVNTLSLISSSASVKFLLLINSHDLFSAKGKNVKESFLSLETSFGGKENLNQYMRNIIIGITFGSSKEFGKIKSKLLGICEVNQWNVVDEQIFCIDPLERDDSVCRGDFHRELVNLPHIPKESLLQLFKESALNAADINMLSRISKELINRSQLYWQNKDLQGIADNFKLLYELDKTGNSSAVSDPLSELRRLVVSNVQLFVETEIIQAIQSPLGSATRQAIFQNMALLYSNSLLVLNSWYEANSTENIASVINNTRKRLKLLEQQEQCHQNDKYFSDWDTLKGMLRQELELLITNNPHVLANVDLKSYDELLQQLQVNCNIVAKVILFLESISQENSNRVASYFFGDQCPLRDFKEEVQGHALSIVYGYIRGAKIQQLTSLLREVLNKLSREADQCVDQCYAAILQISSTVVDFTLEGYKEILTLQQLSFTVGTTISLRETLKELVEVTSMHPAQLDPLETAHAMWTAFWVEVVSKATVKSRSIALQAFRRHCSHLEEVFYESICTERKLLDPFTIQELTKFDNLVADLAEILLAVDVLSGDVVQAEGVKADLVCLGLKLKQKMKEVVTQNLNNDLIEALKKWTVLLNEASDSSSIAMHMNIEKYIMSIFDSLIEIDALEARTAFVSLSARFEKLLNERGESTIKSTCDDYAASFNAFTKTISWIQPFISKFQLSVLSSKIDEVLESVRLGEKSRIQQLKSDISRNISTLKDLFDVAVSKFAEMHSNDESGASLFFPTGDGKSFVNRMQQDGCIDGDVFNRLEQYSRDFKELKRSLQLKSDGEIAEEIAEMEAILETIKSVINETMGKCMTAVSTKQSLNHARRSVREFLLLLESNIDNQYLELSRPTVSLINLGQVPIYASATEEITRSFSNLPRTHEMTGVIISEWEKGLARIKQLSQARLSEHLASNVALWCLGDELANHAEEVLEIFNQLKWMNPIRYSEAQTTLQTYCAKIQDEGLIQTYITAKNFNAVFSCQKLLIKLQKHLQLHFVVDYSILTSAISSHVDNLYRNSIGDIQRQVTNDDFLDFSNLNLFMEVYRSLQELAPVGKIQNLKDAAMDIFVAFVNNLQKSSIRSHTVQEFTRQFVKYYAVATELEMVDRFSAAMVNVLHEVVKVSPELIEQISGHIFVLQGNALLDSICSKIIDKFAVFSRVNISKFNRIAGGMTFDVAVDRLSVTSTSVVDKEHLRLLYQNFQQEYNNILEDVASTRYNQAVRYKQLADKVKIVEHDAFELSKVSHEVAVLLAYICGAYTYFDAKTTFFTGEKDTLLQIHATQVLSIFLLLGLDVPGKSTGQLNQVLTGEGKSITLAVTAALFALLKIETKVVCFSEYLTHKDKVLFQKFFEELRISNRIEYTTIGGLTNSLMKHSLPDLRDQARKFLQGRSVPVFCPRSKCGVLLIDEVDVFFGPDFYGQTYHPAIHLQTDDCVQLYRFMWQNKAKLNTLSDSDAVTWLVDTVPEVIQRLLKEFPRLEPMLKTIISDTLKALKRYFPEAGVCKVKCICQDGRIGVLNTVTGAVSYSTISPEITFAHFFYHEVSGPDGSPKISENVIDSNSGIVISCGRILYSELPNHFQLIHGVSGTLSGFSEGEKEILRNYGFTRGSFIPSTFSKTSLLNNSSCHTTVWMGDRNVGYFNKIKESITAMVKNHRATLVFFDTFEELEWFRAELEKKTIKLPNYRAPEILTEALTVAQRDGVIARSVTTSKVTLSTKTYMRGTDFKCRDAQLFNNGGVHVIMTFYPDTFSDEEQGKGRTCRQSDPGSVQKILFADHLVDNNYIFTRSEGGKDIPDLSLPLTQFPDEPEEHKRWDLFLDHMRSKRAEIYAKSLTTALQSNKPKHDTTLRLSELMASSDNAEVLEAMEILTSLQK